MERSQLSLIAKDLGQKLVFLIGSRQVEKTHLALDLLKKSTNEDYLKGTKHVCVRGEATTLLGIVFLKA